MTRSPPTIFFGKGFPARRSLQQRQKAAREWVLQKNATEGSLEEDRKLNVEGDAFGIPQQNTTETLFTLGDLLETKVSRRGATAHMPLEVEGKKSRGCTMKMVHLASSPLLPQSTSPTTAF